MKIGRGWKRAVPTVLAGLALVTLCPVRSVSGAGRRTVISLDGVWDIAQGGMDTVPAAFDRRVPVPGLVDMARPAFADVGRVSEERQAFWYRRSFKVPGNLPEIAILKVHKAKYGIQIWLNGQEVGTHLPCFTPALFYLGQLLREDGQENELVIRVGAHRENLPATLPRGWDFEKYLYIPEPNTPGSGSTGMARPPA